MKILVRGTNWIGDAVMSIPAMRELRRIFPGDHITLHTRSWADGLFRDAAFIDEIVTYDPHRWKIKDALDNSDFLRDDGFELAILLPNSFESALTTYLTKIPRRIGYNKDLRGLLLTDPIAVPEWKNRRHEVYYYLNLIAEVEKRVLVRASVDAMRAETVLEISDERKAAAHGRLAGSGVTAGKKTIGLVAGSANNPAKRWPVESFGSLAQRLVDTGSQVVLIGSDDETDVSQAVVAASGRPLVDLTGETSLDEAVAILSVLDCVVSNDTGLAHVAPAVGTRTVAIFGPTDPVTTAPFSPNATIVLGEKPSEWPDVESVLESVTINLLEQDGENDLGA